MNMNSAYRIPTQTITPEMISILMRQSNQDTPTFDAFSFSPPASLTSSYTSSSSNESASSSISKSQISGLSRSRCVGNLSALGGAASETSTKRRKVAKSGGPNQGWGYFVDTPDQKK